MFDGRWRTAVDRTTSPVGEALHRHGITADVLTATGLVSATATAVLVASGHLHWAILMLIVTGMHDLLDGPVAKAAGTASVRGAFFDSVTDRIADAVLMMGCAWYLLDQGKGHLALLPMAILAVTALISYERAKAESLGLSAKGGLMERAERMFLLGVAFLSSVDLRARAVGALRPRLLHGHRSLREGVERRLGPRRDHSPSHRGVARGPSRLALAGLARGPGVRWPATPRSHPRPHHDRGPGRPLAGTAPGGAQQPLGPDDAGTPSRRASPFRDRPHTRPPDATRVRVSFLTSAAPRRSPHRSLRQHTSSTSRSERSTSDRRHTTRPRDSIADLEQPPTTLTALA